MWIVKHSNMRVLNVMKKTLVLQLILLLSAVCHDVAFAETQGSTRSWNTAIITGPLSANKKIQYYLQPAVYFIDDKYKLHYTFFYAGVGYQPSPDLVLWLMDGYYYIQNSNGTLSHQNFLREQLNWDVKRTSRMDVSSVTRLEERKNFAETQWALRFRQRGMLRLPFRHWENHSLVVFDEVFFNLNHPKWVNSNSVLEQNRAFVGIGTQLTKEVGFDIGYLNQYQIRTVNVMGNVLYLVFNINTV